MRKAIIFIIVLLAALAFAQKRETPVRDQGTHEASQGLKQPPGGFVPDLGFVPDQQTAVRIAEAVLIPIYGDQLVASERPFHANLKNNVWTVSGTLHCPNGAPMCDGGTATVKLSKEDGRILYVIHYK